MSLKAFHLLFVAITTMLCIFLAIWGAYFAPLSVEPFAQKISFAGIAGAILMPIYGIYFFGKIKSLSTKLEE